MANRSLINILGYSGVIPFVVGVLAAWNGMPTINGSELLIFATYSALILSFLAGILWGRTLDSSNGNSLFALTSSNGFVLLAWISLLILSVAPRLAVLLLGTGFLLLLLIERGPFQSLFASVDAYYKYYRFSLTMLVIAAHIFVLMVLSQ